jgi:prophage DNA circulation protein
MVRENGVLVAVTDLQSGTWQMARDMFEVLQKELGLKKKDLNEVKINTKVIQEVSNDITALIRFTSNVKMNNTKILNLTKKIDRDTNEITEALNLYKNKLRSAIE